MIYNFILCNDHKKSNKSTLNKKYFVMIKSLFHVMTIKQNSIDISP